MPGEADLHPVLVADDDTDDLFFAQRLLQKAGVRGAILTCVNGHEVVELLKKLTRNKQPFPRTIFLDVKMPILSGFETLTWIRSQKQLRKVGVIMLSGSHETRDVELARELGADDYLVKYPTAEEFSRVLTVRR